MLFFFFFQAEDGIRDLTVTGVQTCALPISEFADLVGTDVPKQSLYENDRRELRADYLARLASAEVDIVYVLTGQRSEGDWLAEGPSELLSCYLSLPPEMQEALEGLARSLRDQFHRPQGAPTLHARRADYRTGERKR